MASNRVLAQNGAEPNCLLFPKCDLHQQFWRSLPHRQWGHDVYGDSYDPVAKFHVRRPTRSLCTSIGARLAGFSA